ncbi:pyruvate kinase [Roseibium sp. TrichSKD4]|nr:pyruvate kinase [Roseibium sp. TrichSKD4]
MSHTDHDRLAMLVERIRSAEEKVGRPIGILADLQGPKLRVGTFGDGPVMLEMVPHSLWTTIRPLAIRTACIFRIRKF